MGTANVTAIGDDKQVETKVSEKSKGAQQVTVAGKVLQTYDYSLFKTIEGNRNIIPFHLQQLRNSMEQEYLVVPIIVNEKYEVIDGQHRLENAKQLKKPVFFIMLKGYGIKQIQRLNSNMKNWNAKDFASGYRKLGFKDYIMYEQFMEKYQFGHRENVLILSGNTRYISREFYSGLFKVKNYEEACQIADRILEYKPFYNGFNRRAFIIALVSLFKNPKFSHAEMLGKLRFQSTQLVDCTNVKQYLVLLEHIYNYKRRDEIVRFI